MATLGICILLKHLITLLISFIGVGIIFSLKVDYGVFQYCYFGGMLETDNRYFEQYKQLNLIQYE